MGNDKFFNVLKAIRRGRFNRCVVCTGRGATLNCTHKACKISCHLPCAIQTGWDFKKEKNSYVKNIENQETKTTKRMVMVPHLNVQRRKVMPMLKQIFVCLCKARKFPGQRNDDLVNEK